MEHLAWILLAALASGFGGYFGSYLKKKGENLATHEDFEKVLAELRLVTQTTKEIETSISDKAWDRQKQWELKKDAVYSIMQALGKADETLHYVSVVEVESRKPHNKGRYEQTKLDAWNSFYDAVEDFERKRSMAVIVCEKHFSDTLMRLKKHLRCMERQLSDGEIQSYEGYKAIAEMTNDFALAFKNARTELRIVHSDASSLTATPQSNVSSAAPSPGPQGPEAGTPARR